MRGEGRAAVSTDSNLREADRRAAADDVQDATWVAGRVRAGLMPTWDCDEPRHGLILKCVHGFPSTQCGECEVKIGNCCHGCRELGGVVVAADLGHGGAREYLKEIGREREQVLYEWIDDVAKRTSLGLSRSVITSWLEHFFMNGDPVYHRVVAAAGRAVLPFLCASLGHKPLFGDRICLECRESRLSALMAVEEAILGVDSPRARQAVELLASEKERYRNREHSGLLNTLFAGDESEERGYLTWRNVDYVVWRRAVVEAVVRELLPWSLGTRDPVRERHSPLAWRSGPDGSP